jgi:DNA-binding NarL/FixJ family response regulator
MKRPRILLADDYPPILEAIRAILAKRYEIVGSVADGKALVEAALRLKPDLIVSDITMPLLSGFEAAVQIKKNLPEMRLLFLSMHSNSAYAKAALRVGGTGYVVKSKMGHELLEAVQSVLDGRIYLSSSISTQHQAQFQDPATLDAETTRTLANPRHAHIVYPYSDDRSLVNKVGYYASSGLRRNSGVILVMTEAHRYAIRRYLKADWNLEALEASRQLSSSMLPKQWVVSWQMIIQIPDSSKRVLDRPSSTLNVMNAPVLSGRPGFLEKW